MDPKSANAAEPLLGPRTICLPQSPPDVLSEVLQDLRLARASYGRSELTAPWGIEIPFKEGVRFHFVHQAGGEMHIDRCVSAEPCVLFIVLDDECGSLSIPRRPAAASGATWPPVGTPRRAADTTSAAGVEVRS